MKYFILLFSLTSIGYSQLYEHYQKNQSEAQLIGQAYAGIADSKLITSQRINPANAYQTDQIIFGFSYSLKSSMGDKDNFGEVSHGLSGFNAYILFPQLNGFDFGLYYHDQNNLNVSISTYVEMTDKPTPQLVEVDLYQYLRQIYVPISYSITDDLKLGISLISNFIDINYESNNSSYSYDGTGNIITYQLGIFYSASSSNAFALTYTPSSLLKTKLSNSDYDYFFNEHEITAGFNFEINEKYSVVTDIKHSIVDKDLYKSNFYSYDRENFTNYRIALKYRLFEVAQLSIGYFTAKNTLYSKSLFDVLGKNFNQNFLTFGYSQSFESLNIHTSIVTNDYEFTSNPFNYTSFNLAFDLSL